MTLVHFDEAIILLMQFSLVISCCNITFSVFWLSQGSVATLIRWGGWSSYRHICHSFLNLIAKMALKSMIFDEVAGKNKLAAFLWPMCTFCVSHRWREIHAHLCMCVSVCLSVCLSLAAFPHYCMDPDVTLGMVGGAPLLCTSEWICNWCTGFSAMTT